MSPFPKPAAGAVVVRDDGKVSDESDSPHSQRTVCSVPSMTLQ